MKLKNIIEANPDGTISKGEDKERAALLKKAEEHAKHLVDMIKKESEKVGGKFRAPGIRRDIKKIAMKYIGKI